MRRLRSRRRHGRAFAVLIVVFAAFLTLYFVFLNRLLPVVKTISLNNARNMATQTMNNAVGKIINGQNVSYDDIMTLEKDGDGKITAVKANTIEIDDLKYKITNEVINELNGMDKSDISIPIGTIIGGQLFTGMGPRIKVKIEPVGSAETKIINEFTAAGINQTRQQVFLEVKTSITIIVSTVTITIPVKSNYTLADTVIVGNVPDSYTVVDDTSGKSSSDKIMIYGKNSSSSGK